MSTDAEKPKATNGEKTNASQEAAGTETFADIFQRLIEEGPEDHLDARDIALDSVQNELVQERDARRAERFYWIFATILAVDIFFFKDSANWSGPIMIGILEFVFLISLGRTLGVEQIWTLTERVIEKWNGAFRGS